MNNFWESFLGESNQIWRFSWSIIASIILVTIYWSALHFLNVFLQKKYSSWRFLRFLKSILIGITSFVSVMTVLGFFVENLSSFLGSLSVLAGALVFALQDFVACFFAWVYIECTDQFHIGDNIQITSGERRFSGWVQHIGFFRTRIRERIGGDTLDKERPSGKIITFPNHFLFKYTLTNATKNHKVLWHSFDITTNFENDFENSKKILENCLNQKFEELIKDPDTFFDRNLGDLHSFAPQIFWHIGDSGVVWTIWFGCRISILREVVNHYSATILQYFDQNKILLAYPTQRLLVEKNET